MSETRKLAAILVADVVGYSRLAGADEERTLARLRALRSDLIDPSIALHHGRVVKRTGDGIIIEFRSVVDAVRCAIEMQSGMVERNAVCSLNAALNSVSASILAMWSRSPTATDGRRCQYRCAARGRLRAGQRLSVGRRLRQVRDKLKESFVDLGEKALKNIAHPVRVFAFDAATVSASRGSAIPSSLRMPDEEKIAAPEKRRPARPPADPHGACGASDLSAGGRGSGPLDLAAGRAVRSRRERPVLLLRSPQAIRRSLLCRSPTSRAIRPRTISPTG